MMQGKLDIPAEAIRRLLNAGTLKECLEILKESLPGIWPDVRPNQLPDEVNRHMLVVMKKGTGELYSPPADPSGMTRIPYK